MAKANFSEPDMIDIPQGDYLMGSDNGLENEAPMHSVWVDVFAIAKYPVVNREYALFIESTGRQPPRFWESRKFQNPAQPVVTTNWYDAMAYCEWLCDLTGKNYRLPTEAEREKASRGGIEGDEYPWGNELPADHLGGRDGLLEPIGTEGPNGYGLYNMSAGVHEWCADFFSTSYYTHSPFRNPKGPDYGDRRVARGGAWRHSIRFSRCAARSSLSPDKQFSDFGFRCAMTIE
ncbi:formylglycine-generating enzyme family protein [candidate division KSB1 bacterium]|nr:formylglycine-generating enzyme family protein [candidate division KSB1 bacterium]